MGWVRVRVVERSYSCSTCTDNIRVRLSADSVQRCLSEALLMNTYKLLFCFLFFREEIRKNISLDMILHLILSIDVH